jgi:hypothetical protein
MFVSEKQKAPRRRQVVKKALEMTQNAIDYTKPGWCKKIRARQVKTGKN